MIPNIGTTMRVAIIALLLFASSAFSGCILEDQSDIVDDGPGHPCTHSGPIIEDHEDVANENENGDHLLNITWREQQGSSVSAPYYPSFSDLDIKLVNEDGDEFFNDQEIYISSMSADSDDVWEANETITISENGTDITGPDSFIEFTVWMHICPAHQISWYDYGEHGVY
jgi:hypothetical protein